MSDEPILRVRSRSSTGSGRALWLPMLILSAGIWVLALSELGQGWEMIRLASGYEPPGRLGALVSATLLNGQTFFGTLDNVTRTTISLRDVFFAQLPPQLPRGQEQEGEPRAPVILRRKDSEWTQSDAMAIPVDRIAFMETVGFDSRIARFIANTRGQPPVVPGGEPSTPATGAAPSPPPAASPPKG